MSNPDIVRVHHMLDTAQEALSFVGDKSRSELDARRRPEYHRYFVKHIRKSPGWLS
jgi:hypothetical protein